MHRPIPLLLFAVLVVGVACTRTTTEESEAVPPTPQQSTLPPGVGELAPYRIEGDVVYVNNRICAVSHSPLREGQLDRYQSRVVYDGPDPRFRGKTLVFNQCCPMCIQTFPELWRQHRDRIMRYHGLIVDPVTTPTNRGR